MSKIDALMHYAREMSRHCISDSEVSTEGSEGAISRVEP
jgi:hypothetical protein